MRTLRRHPQLIVVTLAITLAGCSSSSPEPVDAVAQAVTATWTAPQCTADGLSSPIGSCSGPWTYQQDTHCTSPSASDCGTVCTQRKPCAAWGNGVGYGPAHNESGGHKSLSCKSTKGTCSPGTAAATTWCNGLAATRQSALVASVPEPARTYQQVATHYQAVPVGTSLTYTVSTDEMPGYIMVTYDFTCTLTNVTVPYPLTGTADPSCTCIATGPASCDHVCSTATNYTAPGAVYPSGQYVHDVACMTHDELPYGTPLEVAAKFKALRNALEGTAPTTVAPGDWLAAVRARLKLLLELRGDLMDAASFAYVQALYAFTDAEPACQTPVTIPATCAADNNSGGLGALLQMCHNLAAGAHVPDSVVTSQLSACLKLFDQTAALPADACRDTFRDADADATRALVGRGFAAISNVNGQWSGLDSSLSAIGAWYDRATVGAAGNGDWLADATDKLLKLFWTRAYGAGAPLPSDSTTITANNVGALLDATFNGALAVDAAVLKAAFSSTATLATAPLVTIVGDALRTAVERLETVSGLHDTACRYLDCSTAPSTQTAQVWQLVAALPDATALATALTAATTLSAQHNDLWQAFDAIRANHARLESAYANAGSPLASLYGSDAPASAAPFAALVRRAVDRTTSYQTFGFFLSDGARQLHAGMQNKSLVTTAVQQHEAALSTAQDTFNNNRVTLVQGLLAQIKGQADITAVQDRVALTTQQMTNTLSEIQGLQAREASERAAFANFQAAFDAELAAGIIDANASAQQTNLSTPPLSTSSSRYTKLIPSGADDNAVLDGSGKPWRQPLKAGEELHFNITGNWAPSCALQRARLTSPAGSDFTVDTSDALTGPEGYSVEWSDGGFHSHSSSYDYSSGWDAEVQLCIKAGYSLGSDKTGWSFQAWVQACSGYKWSGTTSDITTNGDEQRTSASFASGIHLDETPYPFAPAGSLLLVLTTPGNRLSILDVQVVQRQYVYVAQQDADAYLVDNDLSPGAGGCISNGAALTVQSTKVTPLGAIATQIAAAMAGTLQEIESSAPSILAQGDLLPTEATLLREDARQRVQQLTGRNLSQLPDAVGALFDTWLSAEIVSLERRAQTARLQREVAADELELGALGHQMTTANESSSLAQLIPMWELRQISDVRLASERQAEVQLLDEDVPPIFALRYAKALAGLRTAARSQLTALQTIDFAAPSDDAVNKLLAVSLAVRNALESAALDSSDYGSVMTAVVFPNPARYGTGPSAPSCQLFGTCNDASRPPSALWRAVDLERAQQVWSAFSSGGLGTFTITPGDLYDPHGGSGLLTCYDAAPVVQNMALYAVHSTGFELDKLAVRPALTIGSQLDFPTAAGELQYALADTDWLFTGIPLLGGVESAAISDTMSTKTTVGQGLSPFTSFTVDFTNFPYTNLPATAVDELVLVFQLETHPTAAPGVAVAACQ